MTPERRRAACAAIRLAIDIVDDQLSEAGHGTQAIADARSIGQTSEVSSSLEPIPMRLICPGRLSDGTPCARLHIDENDFATKAHHTHACQHCGEVWRPAIVPTIGVQFLPGFRNQ